MKNKKKLKNINDKLLQVIVELGILQEDFAKYKRLNPGNKDVFEHPFVRETTYYLVEDRLGVGFMYDVEKFDKHKDSSNYPYKRVGLVYGIPSTGVNIHSEKRFLPGMHVYVYDSRPREYIQIISIDRDVEEWNTKQVDGSGSK